MICKMHLYNLIKLNILCSPVIFFFFNFIWKISGICENSYCFRHKNPSSFIEQIICKYDLYLHSVVDVGWMSVQWFIVHLDLFVRKPACDLIDICLTHTCLYFPFCSVRTGYNYVSLNVNTCLRGKLESHILYSTMWNLKTKIKVYCCALRLLCSYIFISWSWHHIETKCPALLMCVCTLCSMKTIFFPTECA